MKLEDDLRVVEALRFVGLRVSSIDDLVNSGHAYPAAIPILIRMLGEVRHPRVKEAIARALSVKEAAPVVHELVREFRQIDPKTPDEEAVKWALGNAIAVAATETHLEDVIALIQDKSHGLARMMLPLALARARTNAARAIDVLREALNDDVVMIKAAETLAKLRAVGAVPDLQRLLQHPDKDIRKAAANALKRLSK